MMNLIDIMGCEYGRSKKWWNIGFYLKCLLILISLVAIFATSMFATIIGFATLLIPISAFWVREKASNHYSQAEKVRRLLLLSDGLGIELPKLEIAQLEVEIGTLDKNRPLYTPPYYDSPLSTGPNRLADIIAESSFFTKNLSNSSAKLFGTIALLGFAIVVCSMYFLIQSNISQTNSQLSAKIVTLMIVFFIAGDFASHYLSYSGLSKVSEVILNKCDKLRNDQAIDINDIIRAMNDYDCALIKSPPIPDLLYTINRDKLNRAWRSHRR
ncbi:MAG: hypothetical protein EPN88_02095 [Bacteroidetes bacterium]|nr:MAG: hypothetical protein EPN88_02095 [Bacteroidota bacterium]